MVQSILCSWLAPKGVSYTKLKPEGVPYTNGTACSHGVPYTRLAHRENWVSTLGCPRHRISSPGCPVHWVSNPRSPV